MRPEAERRANASEAQSSRDSGAANARAAGADRMGGKQVPPSEDRGGNGQAASTHPQASGGEAGSAQTTNGKDAGRTGSGMDATREARSGRASASSGDSAEDRADANRSVIDPDGATDAATDSAVAGLANDPASVLSAGRPGLAGGVQGAGAEGADTVNAFSRPTDLDVAGPADSAGGSVDQAALVGTAGIAPSALPSDLADGAADSAGRAALAGAAGGIVATVSGGRGVQQASGAGGLGGAQGAVSGRASATASALAARAASSEGAGLGLAQTAGETGLLSEAFEAPSQAGARFSESGAGALLGEGLERALARGNPQAGSIEIVDFKRLWVDAAQGESEPGAATLVRAGDPALVSGMGPMVGRDGGLLLSAGQAGLISTPLRMNGNFQEGLMQRFQFMLGTEVQQARVIIDPPQLGPLDLRVAIQGGEAQVQMTAQQAATRDLLEQSLPRLREMFAEAGLQLTDADIRHGHQGTHNGSQDARGVAGGFGMEGESTGDEGASPVVVRHVEGYGLLDVYA